MHRYLCAQIYIYSLAPSPLARPRSPRAERSSGNQGICLQAKQLPLFAVAFCARACWVLPLTSFAVAACILQVARTLIYPGSQRRGALGTRVTLILKSSEMSSVSLPVGEWGEETYAGIHVAHRSRVERWPINLGAETIWCAESAFWLVRKYAEVFMIRKRAKEGEMA